MVTRSPWRWLGGWLLVVGCLLAGFPVWSANGLAGILDAAAAATAVSRSGQFVVHGHPPPAAKYGVMRPATDVNPVIDLQPQALAITAERVQLAVLNRLGAAPAGIRGRFHLFLIPTNRFGAGPLEILPRPFREGWQYHVGIPESVDWRRLVRGLSEVVILELANRNGTETLARTPLWLNEGLAGIVEIEDGRSLVQEPEVVVMRAGRRGDPLFESRAALAGVGAMTFSELSQPSFSALSDTNQFNRFHASSVLLTQQLLQEEGGTARLRQSVLASPQYLNWEFAFLRAHEGRFLTVLDVEKWWAVNSTAVLSRDPFRRWTREQTVGRMKEVMMELVNTQSDTNAPALRRQMPVGEFILGTEFVDQRPVIERKLAQLREIYRQAPDEVLPLVEEYFRSLENYLKQRETAGQDPTGRGAIEVRSRLLARLTARRLADLDRKLAGQR